MIFSSFLSLQLLNNDNFSRLREMYGSEQDLLVKIDGRRPSLPSRRSMALWMVRQLLHEKGIMSLTAIQNIFIERLPSGAPCLKGEELELGISISHSGLWVACGLFPNDQQWGLDIEDMSIQRDYARLAAYAFTVAERDQVDTQTPLGFYRLWTAKEALAKASGRDLSSLLNVCFIENGSVDEEKWSVRLGDQSYQIYHKCFNETVFCSLATSAESSFLLPWEQI